MTNNMRNVTILFLRKENEILLAMKKRGFGEGLWNGVGGKQDEGELINETAKRETSEEIGVVPLIINKVAIINFYFPNDKKEINQKAHVYFCYSWKNTPVESEEMRPKWFKETEIPYDQMWSDDIIWLPKVLSDEKIEANFYFDEDDNVLNYDIVELLEK